MTLFRNIIQCSFNHHHFSAVKILYYVFTTQCKLLFHLYKPSFQTRSIRSKCGPKSGLLYKKRKQLPLMAHLHLLFIWSSAKVYL